ncbi:MAG TPA: hypothetical protein VGX76_24580 [Pirellulales bacterium]|jgi:hypothetical protein|nr:hypothetical protein [Pirellulales bacterium]
MNTDRQLLLGILALQNSFIDRQLVAAFDRWTTDKLRPLADVLVEQGALAPDERRLLEALVEKQLARHGDDLQESLAHLTVAPPTRDGLRRLADAEVDASLAHVATVGGDDDDRTLPVAVGDSTSSA